MNTGKYVIQYGKEPFFSNRQRREAEGALHHSMSMQTYAYVVLVSRYSDERTLNELVGTRKIVGNKKAMAKWIKLYKTKYKGAKVESLGFDKW